MFIKSRIVHADTVKILIYYIVNNQSHSSYYFALCFACSLEADSECSEAQNISLDLSYPIVSQPYAVNFSIGMNNRLQKAAK